MEKHPRPLTPDVKIISNFSQEIDDEYSQSSDNSDDEEKSVRSVKNRFVEESEDPQPQSLSQPQNDQESDSNIEEELLNDYSSSIYCNDFDDDEFSSIPDRDNSEHIFHMNVIRKCVEDIRPIPPIMNPKKYKNGTRKSLTFTNNEMRDIERQNRILLQKILDKGPSYTNLTARRGNSASSISVS